MELPWTEKYRPKVLDEIVGQDVAVNQLKAYIKKGSLSNLIFSGPAGVGKSTAAYCIAMAFSVDLKYDFLELNASTDRGIDVFKYKRDQSDEAKRKGTRSMKDYARKSPVGGDFKIIFLDEADELTPPAQTSFRRTMENFSKTCRFILSCNQFVRIILPIKSRCITIKFNKLPEEAIKRRLIEILKKENIRYTDDGIDAITYLSDGDIRRSINIAQSAATYGLIDKDNVYEIAAKAKPEEIRGIISLALGGKFLDARNTLYGLIRAKGMSGYDIIKQMHSEVTNLDIEDKLKAGIISRIGEYEFRLIKKGVVRANEQLQLEGLLANICMLREKGQV